MVSKLLFLVFGLLFGILFGEILVRATGAAPQIGITSYERYRLSSNPKRAYEPVEYQKIGADQSNRLGYRGPVYDTEKAADVFRIVVIGDSVSEGLLVETYEQTYSSILENELRKAGVKAEVLNFAVNGYNTQQEVETLKDVGLAFHPDLILLQYALNDTSGDDGGMSDAVLKRASSQDYLEQVWTSPLIRYSHLARFIKYKILSTSLHDRVDQTQQQFDEARKDTVAEALTDLRNTVGQHCVLLAVFPWFEKGLTPYPYADHHARVAEYSSKEKFYFIDLLEDFRKCEKDSNASVHFDHVHPNVEGHHCAGIALAKNILDSKLNITCMVAPT